MIWLACFSILILAVFLYCEIRDARLLAKVTRFRKGTRTERKLALKLLKHKIPAKAIFHDLYVHTYDDHYCQVDLVVATQVGIIVFEVKKLSGWIFGNTCQRNWTQVLAYGNVKHRFYNPIMQNQKHVDVLKQQLSQFSQIPFYSVIVLYGDCELKTECILPESTFLTYSNNVLDVVETILSKDSALYTNKKEVVETFKKAVSNSYKKEIRRQHVTNIRNLSR
jgi:hypothetical protein